MEVETASPNRSSKASRCSSRVRSSLASEVLRAATPLSIAPFLAGLPGIGSGSTSPVSLRLLSQRFMVGIDTEKVLATSSLGVPASTAASTLNLRSFEYGFMPGGYHIMDRYLRNSINAMYAPRCFIQSFKVVPIGFGQHTLAAIMIDFDTEVDIDIALLDAGGEVLLRWIRYSMRFPSMGYG